MFIDQSFESQAESFIDIPTPSKYRIFFSHSVTQLEAGTKVLVPKEDQDGNHGDEDEASGEASVRDGRSASVDDSSLISCMQ